jgi:hypothetical protein
MELDNGMNFDVLYSGAVKSRDIESNSLLVAIGKVKGTSPIVGNR